MSITKLCGSIDAIEQELHAAKQNLSTAVLERDTARKELEELKASTQAAKEQAQQRLAGLQGSAERLKGQVPCYSQDPVPGIGHRMECSYSLYLVSSVAPSGIARTRQ